MHTQKSVAFVYAGSRVCGHLSSLFFCLCRLTGWERQSGLCESGVSGMHVWVFV